MSEPEILFETRGAVGLVTLNRPQALNALTLNMIRLLAPQLEAWEKDPAIAVVVVRGSGNRAFCAGGDVRAVYESGLAFKAGKGNGALTRDFFREEYQLNKQIHHFSKPYIALIDGIVMGGGVGLSVHGSHRIATERTMFAMPECGIGFFPDVGATYFLNRCPGQIGRYLALTGAKIGAADCLYAHIATHVVSAHRLDALVAALTQTSKAEWEQGADKRLAALLTEFSDATPSGANEFPLAQWQKEIDAIWGLDSVEAIMNLLEQDGDKWAQDTLKLMRGHCPLSLKVALHQLTEGRFLDLPAALEQEYHLSQRFMAGDTFFEGIRAQLVDKDRNPKWQPAQLADVLPSVVLDFFDKKTNIAAEFKKQERKVS